MNDEQLSILEHAAYRAPRGNYCGDSPDMQVLVSDGLMEYAGSVSWSPDRYYRLTDSGRAALNEWEKNQRA